MFNALCRSCRNFSLIFSSSARLKALQYWILVTIVLVNKQLLGYVANSYCRITTSFIALRGPRCFIVEALNRCECFVEMVLKAIFGKLTGKPLPSCLDWMMAYKWLINSIINSSKRLWWYLQVHLMQKENKAAFKH